MPELPELEALAGGLTRALRGRVVEGAVVWLPGAVRTADPPLDAVSGLAVVRAWRRGKLVGVDMEGDGREPLALVVHLMQSGRLGVAARSPARRPRAGVMAVRLADDGELRLRELGTEHRASVHLLRAPAVADHPPLARLGPEPLGLDAAGWRAALAEPPARLHVALREGRRVAGIGRLYATEIMWAARLAPFARTDRLGDEEWERLARAADLVLGGALERARERIDADLPDREARVTAAYGHRGDPCLRCGTRLERVSFRGYELVYCPTCQTGGRIYADRRTSRFLR